MIGEPRLREWRARTRDPDYGTELRYLALVSDPRNHLPQGNWTVRATRQAASEDLTTFWVVATEPSTSDKVTAYIVLGDPNEYPRDDWGLPTDLPDARIWHLSRIEPRTERAQGGTKSLIQSLAKLADAAGVWITTEVKTHSEETNSIMMAILRKNDFISKDPAFPEMMTRRPR